MPLDNNDIQQLIAILQKGLTQESENTKEIDTTPKKKKRGKIEQSDIVLPKSKSRSKKTRTSEFDNRFDKMMEKNLHKEDTAIDKLLSKYPPTVRSREFSPVDVRCRVCGEQDSINPALLNDAPNRYKCNKCSKEPG